MRHSQHNRSHFTGSVRRLGSALIDSGPAIAGFAGFVGMLVYQVVLYGSAALLAILTGMFYLISGKEFMRGLTDLNEIAQNSITVGTEWNPVSWYGTYLVAISMLANFVGARVAGRLAPEREYWSAVAMIVIIHWIAHIFDYADFNAPIWFNALSLVASIFTAFLGAYCARRVNVIAP